MWSTDGLQKSFTKNPPCGGFSVKGFFVKDFTKGCKVPRVLIHLLSHILRRHGSWIHVLGKKVFAKTLFQVRDVPITRTETRQEWENSRTPTTTEWWRPPRWPPTQCTCIRSSRCTQQSELGMQVHCAGGQRGGHHHSVVHVSSVLEFSHPCHVSVLCIGPSLTWNNFLIISHCRRTCLSLVTSNEMVFVTHLCKCDITLQTNALNASDEIVSATHLLTRYHTANERVSFCYPSPTRGIAFMSHFLSNHCCQAY